MDPSGTRGALGRWGGEGGREGGLVLCISPYHLTNAVGGGREGIDQCCGGEGGRRLTSALGGGG